MKNLQATVRVIRKLTPLLVDFELEMSARSAIPTLREEDSCTTMPQRGVPPQESGPLLLEEYRKCHVNKKVVHLPSLRKHRWSDQLGVECETRVIRVISGGQFSRIGRATVPMPRFTYICVLPM